MNYLLDNITASMILGTVLLSLVFITQRNRTAMVEATAFYSMNTRTIDFIYVLQRDLQNASSVDVVSETDSTFTFDAQTDLADTTKHEVMYQRTKVGDRDGKDLFQILRFVDSVYAGGSMSTLTEWEIQGLDGDGNAAAAPADVRQIYVRFKAVSPIQTSSEEVTINETDWEATFHPQMMQ